jgi:hypothetical protein
VIVPPIRQERRPVHEGLHFALSLSKLVNLLPRLVSTLAPSAVSTFHMLDHVGARFETLLLAQETGDNFRAVDLHVHVQFVLAVEHSLAFSTCKVGRRKSGDAILAARAAIAFHPLVATELAVGTPDTAFRAAPPHSSILQAIGQLEFGAIIVNICSMRRWRVKNERGYEE